MGYWEDRQTAMYKAGEMQINEYFSRLEQAFNRTRRELQRTIESFYQRYAKENGVSYADAQRLLSKTELGELQDYIDLVKQNIGKVSPEVENLSLKSRVTRYEAMHVQMDAMLQELYTARFQQDGARVMKDVYTDTYSRTWYNIDQYRGFHSEFAQADPKVMEKLLEYPFNGASFSSRIWKQKDDLQASLTESLTRMLVTGQTPQDIAAEMASRFKTKKFEAYRLLHTESSFLMSQATHAGYQEDGVEKYQILATLDSKTCGTCGYFDEKVYNVKEAVVGVNMPPFHPFCRCTDVPYYDDEDLTDQTRAARNEDGELIEVPATMSYEEWKEKVINVVEVNEDSEANKTLYKGLPLEWKDMGLYDLAIDVNPYEREDNCVNCTVAYEIRSRYRKNVIGGVAIAELLENPFAIWENAEPITVDPGENVFSTIDNYAAILGNGSRIQVAFSNRFYGHSFVAERRNNATVFLDVQHGIRYDLDNIKEILTNAIEVRMFRIDDATISKLGIDACESR